MGLKKKHLAVQPTELWGRRVLRNIVNEKKSTLVSLLGRRRLIWSMDFADGIKPLFR